jgi:uncharacterized protein YbjT (DUF2867 family)
MDENVTSSEAASEVVAVEPPRKITVVGEIPFAGKAVADMLLSRGLAVRVLCPDEAAELAVRGAVPPASVERLEILRGSLGVDAEVAKALDGVYGVVFVSPISLKGRLYRSAEHIEDVKRVAHAAEKAALRKLVYHSSTAAHPESRAACLRDAALAEGIIKESRCEDFVLRTPPLMGRNDGLVQDAVNTMRAGSPFMSIWGYGGTEMNPLHATDFARCVSRVFVDEPNELSPNVYLALGPERTSPMELYDVAAEKLKRFKFKFHLPLFVLRAIAGTRGEKFVEEVELLFELDDSRRMPPARIDTEILTGSRKLMSVKETTEEIVALAK